MDINNNITSQFLLNKDVTFLNFGSFGACVKPVFEKYQQLQLELEQEPVQFITAKGLQLLKESRLALGNYINCNANDVVYVTNPSYAVNAVAKSLQLQKEDEILTTNLEYGACDKTWEYYCNKAGAKYVRQQISFPITTKEAFVKEFFKGLTAKTKMVFVSHITSTTALRLPVEEICAIAKQKGLLVFVDGAHAPAQVEVDLQKLNVDFYTGACHKWMMTPKGSSFLYVKKVHQHLVDPLIVSWGYNALFPSDSTFIDYHQMNGTRDFTAFLTIPAAINFMQQNNWQNIAAQCRNLTMANAKTMCDILNTKPLCNIDNTFLVQMFSASIKTKEPEKLKQLLYEKYKIEIPVMRHFDKVYLRYSIQAFNTQQDLDNLFKALKDIIATTNLIEP